MTKHTESQGHDPQAPEPEPSGTSRRRFFALSALIAMWGGLVAGYGKLLSLATRYLYAEPDETIAWQFVAIARQIPPDGSIQYTSPAGARVTVTRQGEDNSAKDFLALSSTCPHLSCQVSWEPQNDRFFCPCHNGVFDAQGDPVSGPVKAANQSLPRYELKVEDGMIFIKVPTHNVTSPQSLPKNLTSSVSSDQEERA